MKKFAVDTSAEVESCRLCAGAAEYRFQLRLINTYDVRFYECRSCGSLQSQEPHWLGACYVKDVSPADTLYLTRNLHVYSKVDFLCGLLGLPKSASILDFGGGLGVLARLLTEGGRRAYCEDAFSSSPFGLEAPIGSQADLVTAVEVLEHLTNPAEDLAAIFGRAALYVFVSTERYHKQGDQWGYLSPESGQHVFFYSDLAMTKIADRFGYRVTFLSPYEALFSLRKIPLWKRLVLRCALTGRGTRLLCAWRMLWHAR